MANHNRRQFLMMAFGAGGMAAVGLAALWRRGVTAPEASPAAAMLEGLQMARRSGRALGSEISMIALHSKQAQAEAALEAAFAELETVEQVMSIYRPESQLSRLNRDGALSNPHPYFVEVLKSAQAMSERSGGAFDATVQPLWELYAAALKSGGLPSDAEIDAARRMVDWTKLEVSNERIALRGSGMKVTLNGIAQGYAGDRVLAAMRAHGVTHALANTGEVATMGRKNGGEPWVAGIQHPRQPDALLGLACLDGVCMSTSGDYNTAFSSDHAYNHIFDPATGRSPGSFSSVSVTAPKCVDADALTKPLFVMSLERAQAFVAATPGAEALFVQKDGRQFMTRGFPLQS